MAADARAQRMLRHAVRARHVVCLADVDDTLTDTAGMHADAAEAMSETLGRFVGWSTSTKTVRRFVEIFMSLLGLHQSNGKPPRTEPARQGHADELSRRVAACQREISQRWGGTKLFSREVLLFLAAQDNGVALTGDQLTQCVNAYWMYFEQKLDLFPDARRLVEVLQRRGIPLYLFTSSDARLTLKPNLQFEYDPEVSRRFKTHRIECLRTRGLRYNGVFVGDPVDKPDPEFFSMIFDGIRHDLGRGVHRDDIIVIGDSYRSDISVPLNQEKAGIGILYKRGQREIALERDRLLSVGSWSSLVDVIEEAGADPYASGEPESGTT